MKFFTDKQPWYVTGLAFDCQECGKCCAGPEEGYVWVKEADIKAIAADLGISVDEMRDKYVRKVGRRMSLKENPANNDCVFLVPNESGGEGCKVYNSRPIQCRTWPFWQSNVETPEDWMEAGVRCCGINRGKLYDTEHIVEQVDATKG